MNTNKISAMTFQHGIERLYERYAIFLAKNLGKELTFSEGSTALTRKYLLDGKPIKFVQDFSSSAHANFSSIADLAPLPELPINEGCGTAHVYRFSNKFQTHIFVNWLEDADKIVILISDMPLTPYFPYNYTHGVLAPFASARDNLLVATRFMNWFHFNRNRCVRMMGLNLPVKNNYIKVISMRNLVGVGNDYFAHAHEEYLVFRNLYLSHSAEFLRKGWPGGDAIVTFRDVEGIKVFSVCASNHYSEAAFNTTFIGDIGIDFRAVNRDIAFQNPGFFTTNSNIL